MYHHCAGYLDTSPVCFSRLPWLLWESHEDTSTYQSTATGRSLADIA